MLHPRSVGQRDDLTNFLEEEDLDLPAVAAFSIPADGSKSDIPNYMFQGSRYAYGPYENSYGTNYPGSGYGDAPGYGPGYGLGYGAASGYEGGYGGGELVLAGGVHVSTENLVQAAIVLSIGVAVIISNIIVLATYLTMPGTKDVIMYYLMSLGVADLIGGVIVVPLSVYPALIQRWVYGDAVCALAGYLEITLWFSQLFTFMWISVDRYLAVRKPQKYEAIQTKTRCQCWVVFTWMTSLMLCCPPLLGFSHSSQWDGRAFVCWLDWHTMIAYAFTLVPLVMGPTLITILYTYTYIFNTVRKLRQCIVNPDKEYVTAITASLANPDHMMCFVLVVAFWASWGPCVGLRAYEYLTGRSLHVRYLHFILFWVGALNSCWKFLIYLTMSQKFRRGLKYFCLALCCQQKPRYSDMNDDD